MIHAPLRGLIVLTRVGLLVAAAAAIPVLIRRCKPLAKQIGDTLIKAGEKLKEEPAPPKADARRPSQKPPQSSKASAARARNAATKPTRRKRAARKKTTRKTPKSPPSPEA